jgi:hypothetical protein
VPYDDMRKESIEGLVNDVLALASVASQARYNRLPRYPGPTAPGDALPFDVALVPPSWNKTQY